MHKEKIKRAEIISKWKITLADKINTNELKIENNNFQEKYEKYYKTIVFIITIISTIIIILYNNLKYPKIGECITIEVDEDISEKDYADIVSVMPFKDTTEIQIDTIAYEKTFRHESSFYITFWINSNQKDNLIANMKILEENDNKLCVEYEKIIFNANEDSFS